MSLQLLNDVILPRAFNRDESKFISSELDSEAAVAHIQSNNFCLRAIVENKHRTQKLSLFVKFELQNRGLRKILGSGLQFQNEVLMYTKVLPLLNKQNIIENTFPSFYYGVGAIEGVDDNVLVIEDLNPTGYKQTKEKLFLDLDHLTIALSKLGKFHALSYAAKKENPNEFFSLAYRLKEPLWVGRNILHDAAVGCFHRAIDPLIKRGRSSQVLQLVLDRAQTDFVKFQERLMAPEEPHAVICHGDFTRNNMFFKYDNNGKPTDVKFFDIANAKYSSPAIDLALIFLLNITSELRKSHWDELLEIYHTALSEAIPGTEVPSLEEIKSEMMQKAVYGFSLCSYFLPMMFYTLPFPSLDFIVDAPKDEVVQVFSQIGGQDGTERMSKLVEELLDRGCLTLKHKCLLPYE